MVLRAEQHRWSIEEGWTRLTGAAHPGLAPQFVLLFASARLLADAAALEALQRIHPGVRIVGCSTAGEIAGTSVLDEGGIATAIEFERTEVRIAVSSLSGAESSRATGIRCARELLGPGLKHVLVLSEGLRVNGSELVAGLAEALPEGVKVTGGLAGDADRFERTLLHIDGKSETDPLIGIGLYGAALQVGIGSLGGWDPFGPDRLITRSSANVLYELDGEPALQLYRRYLGPHAAGLPGNGLLFPLSLRSSDGEPRVVRTILGMDEAKGSLTFAGDVPQGAYAQLMKANVDRLIDGAVGAATSCANAGGRAPELAILISCVGRKLVMKQRVEEEVESVRDVLGAGTTLTGFYSYGEVAPFHASARCELHNQTMTITTLAES